MLEYKEYVYAVYREQSFSKAARKLFVSQPWLSSVVKKTEKKLGVLLFDRSSSPVKLTAEGKYFIDQIERIKAIEREMEEYYAAAHTRKREELCIGSSMFFCTYVLPQLMEDFCTEHSDAGIRFLEGDIASLTEKLQNGTLDLLLDAEKPIHKGIVSTPWAEEEIMLAVPADNPINEALEEYRYSFLDLLQKKSPIRDRPPVPLKRFENERFLFLNPGNDSYDRCMKICRNAGFTPNISMQLSQMMTAYYLVCEGRGVAFLRSLIPQFVLPTESVVFYRLEDSLAKRTIYLTYREQLDRPLLQDLFVFLGKKRT